MTIESNRTLGGLGAAFTVVGAVSTVLSLLRYLYPTSIAGNLAVSAVAGIISALSLVGFLLFLVAMYGFSRDYSDHRIFNFVLYGIIIAIIAAIVVVAFMVAWLFANLVSVIPNFSSSQPSAPQIEASILPLITPFLAAFGFIGLINIVFNVRAFNLLGQKSSVPMFKTAAKVLLAGGLLLVVLSIVFSAIAWAKLVTFDQLMVLVVPGGLVQEAAWVLLAVAFFRIQPPPVQSGMRPTFAASTPLKACSSCGAQNHADSSYCERCGHKF